MLTDISLQYNEIASNRNQVGTSQVRDRWEKDSDQSWMQYPRLDFLIFNRGELKSWVVKVDYYLEVTCTPIKNRVKLAAMHLERKALQWHQGYIRIKGKEAYSSWKIYV